MGQLPKFNTENEDLDQVLQAELSSSNCTTCVNWLRMCVLDIKLVSTAHTYQCFSGFYLEGDFVYFGLLAKWCCKNCKNAHSLGHTFAQHFYHHQLANWG